MLGPCNFLTDYSGFHLLHISVLREYSESKGERVKKIVFFIGFGLLPVIAAIIFIYVGSRSYHGPSSEYWTVAPWYIIAAMPVSLVTFSIAAITLLVYGGVSGDRSKKRRTASVSFALLVLVAICAVGIYWIGQNKQKQSLKHEQFLAQAFVMKNPSVIQAAGETFEVYPAVVVGQIPIRYEFSVKSDAMMYAIVDVSRESGHPVFSLACITSTSIGYRDSSKHPCAQDEE